MLRFHYWRLLLVWLALMAGGESAKAFSFWGTKETYQADNLGYGRTTETEYRDVVYWVGYPEFTFAPHNLGEEFRWSIPTLYYAYDASFLGPEYFGSNGVHAVDSAFGILNALTNVSSYSEELSEFPLDEARFNYTAQALHLFDLKSAALEMLVTRLGLADPERFTWTIRSRSTIPPLPCPFFSYRIVHRNFDPVTFEPTPFVNGNLYTYIISQHCPPDLFGDRAEAIEFLVDPLTAHQTAVASPKISFPTVFYYGMYHSGLTRDDVGGLRYLYRANNMNVEMAPPEAILFQTNYNTTQLLFTSNLTLLVNQSLTNDAAALQLLYPNLVITSSTPIYTNVTTTNIFFYFTNLPYAPAGTFYVATGSNVTTDVLIYYAHTFANVVTNTYYTNASVTVLQAGFYSPPNAPAGTFYPRTTLQTLGTNYISGDYFILPTNSQCGISIIATLLTNVVAITNNPLVATNAAGQTNINGQQFAQATIFYVTNRVLLINPVACATNSVDLRQGLEKISFVKRDYDSLINRYFYPITNEYSMIAITNSRPFVQKFQRIVVRPDILIAAADAELTVGPNVDTVDHITSSPSLNNSNALNRLAGPGTFEGPMTLTFNKVGPVWLNTSPAFIDERSSIFYFNWASFDGTTNAPLIYPDHTSIRNLESQILIQVTPTSLPNGNVGVAYDTTLTVTGGQPPYSWTNAPGSSALPSGMSLVPVPGNGSQVTISGTPIEATTNAVRLRLLDAGSRFVDTVYTIRIAP